MGLVLVEGSPSDLPARFTDSSYLLEREFPSCDTEIEALELHGAGFSCPCWEDPENYLDNGPRSTHRCSKTYLCGDVAHSSLEPQREEQSGARRRSEGRKWRFTVVCIEVSIALSLFVAKRAIQRGQVKY